MERASLIAPLVAAAPLPRRCLAARRSSLARLLALCALASFASCARGPAPAPERPPARETPKRIVSLSPSVSEILAGVGAFDRVVAVSMYCTYPPEAARLPRVGNWLNANMEQLAALRPDLVVMNESQAPFQNDKLRGLGFRTLVVRSITVEDALAAMRSIGAAVGDEAAGERLARETESALADIRGRTRDLPRPRVLCVVDRVPGTLRDLYTASGGSFLAQLIDIAGARSIAPRASSGWGKVTKEAVLGLDPEIILDMVQGSKGRFGENPKAVWSELGEIDAVRRGRIYPFEDVSVLHPSQFIATTARRFAEIFHPEAFPRENGR